MAVGASPAMMSRPSPGRRQPGTGILPSMDPALLLPYSGLSVLDLSQGIAGPYCAEILLQNGATVTKVEPPSGDWSRGIGLAIEGLTALTVANNLGKRSICVDAASDHGREVIRRLAGKADVLVESFRPGVM